jgi:hypothetical protein
MTTPVTDSVGWDELWRKNLECYVQGAPRTGVFVHHLFPDARTYLELGAGSARDSFHLSQLGKVATASDFSPAAVEGWRRIYSPDFRGKQVDVFNIDAPESAFDVTFHNGLFVYFGDDQIKRALVEQRRVTRQAMVIIVHNKRDTRRVRSFEALRETNPLFRIRFFEPEEIASLVKASGIGYRDLSIHKFGGPSDLAYRVLKTNPHTTQRNLWLGGLASRLKPLTPWSRAERTATTSIPA